MKVTEAKAIGSFVRDKIDMLNDGTPKSQAACANLRRAIGKEPGASPDIWDLTLRGAHDSWGSRHDNPSYEQWAIHTALTLYALHYQGKDVSMNDEKRSFASATASIAKDDEGRREAIRRRFNAVATAMDFTELAYHARGIIQMLKAEDIPMNYPQFTEDLYLFQIPGLADGIRLRWGEDFYKVWDHLERKDDDKQ